MFLAIVKPSPGARGASGSRRVRAPAGQLGGDDGLGPDAHGVEGPPDEDERDGEEQRGQAQARRGAALGGPSTDRKSTRLNSSHRTISYAVFCLKKKTSKTDGKHE